MPADTPWSPATLDDNGRSQSLSSFFFQSILVTLAAAVMVGLLVGVVVGIYFAYTQPVVPVADTWQPPIRHCEEFTDPKAFAACYHYE